MTPCRIPEDCQRYKVDIRINDLTSKRILPRSVKQRDRCLYYQKNNNFVICQKNGKDTLVNGVREIEAKSNYVENKKNEDNFSQRIGYRFPKHETIDQLENVFVFESQAFNVEIFAESYAAVLFDLSRLQDRWDRDIAPDELVTEKDSVIISGRSNGNPVMNMPKYGPDNYEIDERT